MIVVITHALSQVKFYETKFNGGVTCAAYSPGTSSVANGTFNIHITPGSTIRKAYLLCGELGDNGTGNFLFDGNPLSFIHNVTQVGPKFSNPNYGDSACVHAIDVTSFILPSDTSYTIAGTLDYTDYYLYVAYDNPSMPIVYSTIFLNDQAMAGTVDHHFKVQRYFPSTGDVGVAFHMGYMCALVDGELVTVNGNFLGIAYGPDANNLTNLCAGPAASFYFENRKLEGLNDDDANLAISGPDVLSNISSLLTPGSDSIDGHYTHNSNPNKDNSIWSIVINYSDATEITNLCLGDTTLFLAEDSIGYFAFQWQFDDPASGVNNSSNYANTSHVFTAPGNYNVTLIRALLKAPFSDTTVYAVTIGAPPAVFLGNDTTLCNGDTMTLHSGVYNSYLWNDGSTADSLTVTVAGIYILTVENTGCKNADSITVSYITCSNAVIANLQSSDTAFCEKHCIDFFDLSANNPTSWQWFFPGADSLASTLQNPANICYNSYGTYNVTLIACNAFGCDTLILTNFISCYQSPVDSIYQSNDTLFSLPAYSYQWYEVTNGIVAGATNQYFIPQAQGSYYCIVTDSVGCAGSSGTIAITGKNQLAISNGLISVNPNPFNSAITVTFQKQNIAKASLTIKNVLGQNVYNENSKHLKNNFKTTLDLSDLPNGIYFLEIVIGELNAIKKIVKQ